MVGLLAALAFIDRLQDVLDHDDVVRLDPAVMTFVLGHRVAWVTVLMKIATWLGSNVIIIPLGLAIGGYFLIRRGNRIPLIALNLRYDRS